MLTPDDSPVVAEASMRWSAPAVPSAAVSEAVSPTTPAAVMAAAVAVMTAARSAKGPAPTASVNGVLPSSTPLMVRCAGSIGQASVELSVPTAKPALANASARRASVMDGRGAVDHRHRVLR
jgi:hypothetical protein